ncbi:MAG: hypothetical protein QNJ47_18690 [Nostocaceae cyanobacterium]|nr:hypothetical protein [Nostocaceae cyanobacterium]
MANEKEGISLKTVVSGLLQALREAKHLGDVESAKLLDLYKKEKTLASFAVPAFTIADVDVELRFAIIGTSPEQPTKGEIPDIKVNISPELLKTLEAHQMNVMKLKISPVSLRVLEESEQS